jgi:hypothetical protein
MKYILNTLNTKIDDCEYTRATTDLPETRKLNIRWTYQKHTLNLPILEEVIFGKIYSKNDIVVEK